jgi:hypothetical protein
MMNQLSLFALVVGAGAMFLSLLVWLLRITRGVPTGKRIRLLVLLVGAGLWRTIPSWRTVSPLAAAGFAFFVSLIVGLGVTVIAVRSVPPEVPTPTEANEAIGDAIMAMTRFFDGAILSFGVSVGVAFMVGYSTACRQFTSIGNEDRLACRQREGMDSDPGYELVDEADGQALPNG